ncbi:hypothetical protein [Ottowia sp.]|uniref:hypothetical protein n=1 Tax=Ottowia sp. TaxID=1898956 RepID=UPI002CECE517|nr:hypothetical protein [Ottowia sp.]
MTRFAPVAVLFLLTLTGCGLQQSVHEDDLRRSRAQCSEYGFAPDSVPYAQCMQSAMQHIDAQRTANFQRSMGNNAAMGNHGMGTAPSAPTISLDFGKSTSTSITNETHITQPPNVTCATAGNAGRCASN